MIKTIVFTANNRPHYLAEMLASLAKNNLIDWQIIGFLEPECPENIEICENSGLNIDIRLNPYRMGVRDNPYNALKTAFDDNHSDIVIYLEDDIAVSPDITQLADFILSQGEFGVLCVSLCNYESTHKTGNIANLIPVKDFNPLGLIITKHRWETYFKPQWYNDNHSFAPSIGWDWSINALLHDSDLHTLQPEYSRSTHIGREGGTHCTTEYHDKRFGKLQICDYIGDIDYKILGET